MRCLLYMVGLLGLAAAEILSSTCSSTLIITETIKPTSISTAGKIITVGTADTQFTAIQDAVSYAQAHAIPTVSVLKGTYPAVTISSVPTVTILGQTNNENDYSQNQVVVSTSGIALRVSTNVKGLTVKNINFVSSASKDGSIVMRGRKNAVYGCQILSSEGMGITNNLGIGLIANSYIKAADSIIFGKGTLYIFNTVIRPNGQTAVIAFNQGTTVDDTLYNSTMVFDRISIVSRGGDNTKVYLAEAKRAGSVVIYRDSSLGSSVLSSGVSIDNVTQDKRNFYGEYANSGQGSYASNVADRKPYVSLMDAKDLSRFSIDQVFGDAYPSFATSDTSWIDRTTLAEIESADVVTPSDSDSDSSSPSFSSSSASQDSSSTTTFSPSTSALSEVFSASSTSSGSSSPNTSSGSPSSSTLSSAPSSTSSTSSSFTSSGSSSNNSSGSHSSSGSSSALSTAITSSASSASESSSPNTSSSASSVVPSTSSSSSSSSGSSSPNNSSSSPSSGTSSLDLSSVSNTSSSPSPSSELPSSGSQSSSIFSGATSTSDPSSTPSSISSTSFTSSGSSGSSSSNNSSGSTSSSTSASSSSSALLSADDASSPASVTSSSASSSSSSSITSASMATSTSLVVSKTPADGQYKSVNEALAAIPDDGKDYTIQVMPGTYSEQLSVNRQGKVTFRGETSFPNDFTKNSVTIQDSKGTSAETGDDEKTPIIKIQSSNSSSSVALYNINFKNNFPESIDTVALAADSSGFVAAYGCAFIGYQHTLYAKSGKQIFSNSYIEGSSDFIYGVSTVYIHQSYIAANAPGGSISAQGRSSATKEGGFVFEASLVTFTESYGTKLGKTYLGRPMADYSRVIYMNSFLDGHVNAAGWSKWTSNSPRTKHVTFGEYNNSGPGQSASTRASFSTQLNEDQAESYSLSNWIGDTSWLDMTAFSYAPSYNVENADSTIPVIPSAGSATESSTGSSATGSSATASSSGSATGSATRPSTGFSSGSATGLSTKSSTRSATGSSATGSATGSSVASPTATSAVLNRNHPSSGTKPPTHAVLVSSGNIDGSYSSLTSALASLPSDNTTQTIFVYPGTYDEQVPTIDREGPVTIIGYTSKDPGRSYLDNQVTITFSAGISITPVLSHTNGETATFSTASKSIAMYNINVINTDNADGSNPSYVTIAASVFGSHVGFYGCSFVGWKNTLLTGGALDNQYYESCYIEGAVDAITGPSKAYFKGCKIGAKGRNSALTAQGRGSPSAIGGYIFDQCLFDVAQSAKVNLKQSVYLSQPYGDYALVVIKNSHITDVINPSGWTLSSEDNYRVQHASFAEYQNIGDGNWENNKEARQKFGHCELLTSDPYTLEKVMDSTDWIDMTYWNSITTPSPAGNSGSSSDTSSNSTSVSQLAVPGTEVPALLPSSSSSPDEIGTVTIVVTTDSTLLTTTTVASATSTVKSTKSLDITVDTMTTTTTNQSTKLSTVTITVPTTQTQSSTKTVKATSKVTPTPITEIKTVNGDLAVQTATAEKATKIVTDTTSTTRFVTKLSKITSTQTVTKTSIKTPITQEITIVTSTIGVTIGSGGTITKPGTATTITSATTITETSTSRITTTLSCVPALRVAPRNYKFANVAAKTTHTDYSTQFKTSTVTISASTAFFTKTTTKTITHASTTVTNTETSVTTQTSYTTISKGTVYSTIIFTVSRNTMTTLVPSTTTLTTTLADRTTITTVAGLVETTTDHSIITISSTVDGGVSTVLDTETTISQSTIPLPTLTSTKIETTILSNTPSVTITYHATSTKTTTVKVTSTTISTISKTASGATTCTA